MSVRYTRTLAAGGWRLALVALTLAACGRTAETPPTPPPEAPAPDVASVPTPPVPQDAWLVWRQDVGAMGVTALIEPSADGKDAVLRVNKALYAVGGGDVWSLGPVTERWALKPCGDDAIGIAMGFRAQKLGLGVADGLAGDESRHHWSTPERRPDRDASEVHTESLIFAAQAGERLFVKHLTHGGPCPVSAEGFATVQDLKVFDLKTGTMADPMTLLGPGEKDALEKLLKPAAVAEIKRARPDLSPETIGAPLKVVAMEIARDVAGRLTATYRFEGTAEAFGDPNGELGASGPATLAAVVAAKDVPVALQDGADAPPAAVAAFLKRMRDEDAPRADAFDNAALYGGAGWTRLPADMVPRVKAALEALRDAPIPDGPTDWD